MKTRLGSTILSRIQPRPDIQIRIVAHDIDPAKEVAVVRVAEGTHPPYMHTKGGEHRIYVRTGAQKAEADYLQLNALYDKRSRTTPPVSVSTSDLKERLSVKVPGQNWPASSGTAVSSRPRVKARAGASQQQSSENSKTASFASSLAASMPPAPPASSTSLCTGTRRTRPTSKSLHSPATAPLGT